MSQYMFPDKQGAPQQAFPGNRSSPSAVPQPGPNFQNVALGLPTPGQNKPLTMMQGNQPPTGAPGQFPSSMAYSQRPQIPQTQLPPSLGQTNQDPMINPFSQPPTKQELPPSSRPQNEPQHFQNGPSQFTNGPMQFQNGPSGSETSNNQEPSGSSSQSIPPDTQSPFTQSTLPGATNQQSGPARPPSNQPSQQTSFPNTATNQFGQSSPSGQLPPNQVGSSGPLQFNQFGGPAGTNEPGISDPPGPPPNQPGQLSNQFMKPPNQANPSPNLVGQPQLNNQPVTQMKLLGHPPTQVVPPTVMGRPPQMGPPIGHVGPIQGQMGPPQGQIGPPPGQMGQPQALAGPQQGQMGPPQGQVEPPPNQMGPPQSQMGPPQGQMGPPQGQMGPPQGQMGPPQGQMGPPQGQMGPPQGQMGPAQSQMGPPQSHMGPPQGQMGRPHGQMGPPQGQMGPPQGHMAPPHGQMGPPQGQMGPPKGQMGPPQGQMAPPLQSQMGPPQGQMGPPQSQLGPPQMNQPPMAPPRAGQPLLPNQGRTGMSINQNAYQYGPGGGPNQPPIGQPGFPPNQLSNQMQNLNLNNQRQYPGTGQKNVMNGEPGPHMPPPINQSSYTNNQQMRGPPAPGYPPMPGQHPMPGQPPMPGPGMASGGTGGYPQHNYPQQPARRLDPDQMPSPIQVTQDDQQNRSGVFVTNQKGLVPPLVTTNFVVQDQGNASPRLIRSTMYNVPITQDLIKQTAVPFSLVISPMARHVDQEYPPPIVDFGELGPVRCIRCKAYMCPFMQFIDSGRRFQCLFCKATTDVPTEYFQHLDHTGQRMDKYERPELVLGTYEFVATTDYCRNNTLPKPPAVIFIIDVSYNNVKSGLVHLLCSQMKEIIQNLPVDQGQEKSNMRVGFITYNSSVHFYNIKGTLAAPQMLVVGDVHEMFMPLLDGFLCTPTESGPVIDALMQQIPAMFSDTRETETILLPAIQAGMEALKASECTGKLVVFHSSLPSADAPGKLKNRDDRKLLGTDKEKTVLTPQNQSYNQLGQDCAGVGCSVDLFIFNNAYIDLATIGQVSRLTGGEIYKYTYFQADLDGERLINDVIINISRPIGFDAIMRVRTSTGVRPTDFYGHFFMSNTTDMELAAIDCDKAVAVEIKHDDKLQEEEGVYIQVALLYTSCSGQRRLRIINLSLKTCSQMADLYRSCDLDTMINYFSKQAVYKLMDSNPKQLKDSIVHRAAQTLATYRKNCASPSSAGQLILPECMKLLPLYINCLLKSDAISGGSDMTIDDRSFAMQAVMTMDIVTSVNYFYPRLIPIHDLDTCTEPVVIPAPIRTSIEKINEQGIYILENGIHMFLWFGLGVNPDIIQKLFGAPSAIQVDIDRQILPELDNPFSLAVRSIIDEIRIQRHRCMRLTIVRQREKLEPVFKHFLVEDQGSDASPSYVDFLCHLHKEIRTLLS